MATVLVQTGDVEPITALLVDGAGSPVTGATNIKIRVRRTSDDFFFDWSDNTFKTQGGVVTLTETMSEVHSGSAPGVYKLDTVSHAGGFDTSAIVNPVLTGDHYVFVLTQDGLPQSAANLPMTGELAVGDFTDFIDQAISENATPAEVNAELVSLRLHHLVSTNPGAIQAGTGTYIKQIIDSINELPRYVVEMSFAYDKVNNLLRGSVWVEYKNLMVPAADLTSVSLSWVEADTETVLFTLSDLTPDARGAFYVEQSNPGLLAGKAYYARAEVSLAAGGTISGAKGSFTF